MQLLRPPSLLRAMGVRGRKRVLMVTARSSAAARSYGPAPGTDFAKRSTQLQELLQVRRLGTE
jgi:hypothetical protein